MPYNGDMEHYGPFQRTPSRSHLGPTQMSGEALLPFSDLLAPTKESTRQTLIQLRCDLGLSRGHMAALLGVRKDHLRRWEKGTRLPSASAQKLVWLLDTIHTKPDRLRDALSIATWGRA
jgi:DNA-binding transcriptional regulator YiaG